MRAPYPSQPRARSRSLSFRFDCIEPDAGPSTSGAASGSGMMMMPPASFAIEDTSCSESHLKRRREQERRARRALLRKQQQLAAAGSNRPPRGDPRGPRGPPLTPSSFATDRFGAFCNSKLEKEFWDWLNPQAVKTDTTTLCMLFGVVGSTALAFAWQQSPWCLYTGTLLYFFLAVACTRYPEESARLRMRVMPWVRVSVLLMTVCNTWARKGTPVRPVGFLPSWLGTSAVALDADEQDALLLQFQQQQQQQQMQQQAMMFDLTSVPRATSLEEASEPANWWGRSFFLFFFLILIFFGGL